MKPNHSSVPKKNIKIKNSKILKGRYFKDNSGSKNLKIVHVYRWDPEKKENPREDTFEVNLENNEK